MFTIEIGKKERNENFVFSDIFREAKVFHNCFGGRIEVSFTWKEEDDLVDWLLGGILDLYCKRCDKKKRIRIKRLEKEMFINTALDGKKRKIRINVCVIRKT